MRIETVLCETQDLQPVAADQATMPSTIEDEHDHILTADGNNSRDTHPYLQDDAPYTSPDHLKLTDAIRDVDGIALQGHLADRRAASIFVGRTSDKVPVAVKIFLEPDPSERMRVSRELDLHVREFTGVEGILPVVQAGSVDIAGVDYRYLATRFCPEGTLRIRRVQTVEQLAIVARVLSDEAVALEEMHRRGFVHRDVKPGNSFLGPSGQGWLGDLGIVTADTVAGPTTPGTMGYIPPETLRGAISPRTDSFALAVTFFVATTGQLPFKVPSQQEAGEGMTKITTELCKIMETTTPKSPHSQNNVVPIRGSELTVRALSPDPDRRPEVSDLGEYYKSIALAA